MSEREVIDNPDVGGELCLTFTQDGTAVLYEDEDQVWSSDADDDFREEHPDERLDEDDAETVLQYLADEGILADEELPHVTVEVEEPDPDNVIETETQNGVDYKPVKKKKAGQ